MTPGAATAPAECVVNVSEGRDPDLVAAIGRPAGDLLLDTHLDPDHHRAVLTLAGPPADVEAASRAVVAEAVARLDLGRHRGVHPRLGVADVVPFVALEDTGAGLTSAGPGSAAAGWALAARDRTAAWLGSELGVPCFRYGPDRTLPEVRRRAFDTLAPDTGPDRPHPTAGASAVGARPVLVAYNVWVTADGRPDDEVLAVVRRVAAEVRGPERRTLGLAVTGGAQVSCNLLAPGPGALTATFDAVAARLGGTGCRAVRGELVGLAPAAVLSSVPAHRRAEVGADPASALESRLEASGLR